jgi:hypothetical protein
VNRQETESRKLRRQDQQEKSNSSLKKQSRFFHRLSKQDYNQFMEVTAHPPLFD